MITAPYNFVPLNKEVFYPDWAEKVSHDVPFADRESGEIDITITAKSPIFIRDHANPEHFCQHNGQYYIPSTSIKGMIRNVLEIMSFGEIIIDEKKLSQLATIRDMSNSKELVGVATGCGFLKQDAQEKWFIEDYGAPRTIEYTNKQAKSFSLNGQDYTFSLNANDENMSAEEKYNLLGNNYFVINVQKGTEDLKNREGDTIGTKPIATLLSRGEEAYLICTGEITNKEHEFVFVKSDKRSQNITNIEDAVANFKAIYFESDSIDGNYWKSNYNPNIGIPVFYRKKDGKYDIGLTQLFKLLCSNTLQNAARQNLDLLSLPKEKKDKKLDLTHTIFGAIRKEADSLKGRVYFSHFKTTAKPKIFKEDLTMTLGGPKPSFYPTYIKQNCQNSGTVANNNYSSLMKTDSEIAGWKKYPLHHNKPKVQSVSRSDTTVTFNPIGTYKPDGKFDEFSFKGKLRYHNLKPQELGAILSALTFHDNQESFYHNIGLAKAHGFGKIEISLDITSKSEYLKAFEAMMTSWTQTKLKKEWIETDQIKELFAMHYKDTNIDDKLKYLILDPDRKINQFSDAKNIKVNKVEKGRECLPLFSKLSNFIALPLSLLNAEYLESLKQKAEEEAQAKKVQQEFELALSTENIQTIKNFLTAYKGHPETIRLEQRITELEKEQQQNQFAKINEEAQKTFDGAMTMAQKNPKTKKKYLEPWIIKHQKPEVNKGSTFILDLIEKAKESIK